MKLCYKCPRNDFPIVVIFHTQFFSFFLFYIYFISVFCCCVDLNVKRMDVEWERTRRQCVGWFLLVVQTQKSKNKNEKKENRGKYIYFYFFFMTTEKRKKMEKKLMEFFFCKKKKKNQKRLDFFSFAFFLHIHFFSIKIHGNY